MNITKFFEYELSRRLKTELQSLLAECFPGFLDDRIYFKQLPTFRFLCKEGETLIGQTGVAHRVINLNGSPQEIFGIVDLCVKTSHRSQGIGRKLLQQVEMLANEHNVNFIVLFADDRRLYDSCGYKFKSMTCTWLKIDEHKTLGVGQEDISDCLMIKEVSGLEWPDQSNVDLLGYMF